MTGLRGFVQKASRVLPEVPKPARKPSLNERLIWCAVVLAVFLSMSQVPLFGVGKGAGLTQLEFINIIFASSQGTLMTLGIGPIVTAGLILQLLKGSEIIKLDFKKTEDRALFSSATKLLTIVVTLGEATAFTVGGILGRNLPIPTMGIIITQLLATGILLMLLDETLQKGWGIGSGISLFIMAGVAQTIMWNVFSVIPGPDGGFIGVIPFLIQSASAGNIAPVVFRTGQLPSLFGLILTIIVIVIIVYVEGIRIEIPITSTKYRGFAGTYPLKLLYVSNIPVILTSSLAATVTLFSQVLWNNFNPANSNPLFNWLVMFDTSSDQSGVIGGLIYYISSPRSLQHAAEDPLRALTFIGFMVLFSVIFARIWVEIGGLSPKAAAKGLIDAQVQVPGFRRTELSVESILARYIPALTIIGGVMIGLLASTANILGVFGSGTGILLMIDITLNYYNMLMREHLESIMPRLGAFLGR